MPAFSLFLEGTAGAVNIVHCNVQIKLNIKSLFNFNSILRNFTEQTQSTEGFA
jgi:hypothetical protein